ncbi:hypothetical protein [Stenotrophomonas rhizophila]|uniref:hypothetical protein n=1 Tax=Stenotrophomonas rhizophila TaxID=216778 RepID=UPI00112F4EEC|nr:hypothetical protein [Stenotrophomonas rhizophila]
MLSSDGFLLRGPDTVEQMEEVLAGLKEIGVVPVGRDSDAPPGDEPPWSNSRGGGGEGGDPISPLGPEGGDGGVGLSEVLGHAVLFCLAEDTQQALLDVAFGIEATEEQVRE